MVIDDNEKVCGKFVNDSEVMAFSKYALLTGGNSFVLPTTGFLKVGLI